MDEQAVPLLASLPNLSQDPIMSQRLRAIPQKRRRGSEDDIAFELKKRRFGNHKEESLRHIVLRIAKEKAEMGKSTYQSQW